ncbi:hypothetical protein B0H13DRAFT_12198 [Mycena leptocephala]|nr:hypothetical protein B0H13DRAFT_12198 [Mycena leptocephala]
MSALCFQEHPKRFDGWFFDTFVPLVTMPLLFGNFQTILTKKSTTIRTTKTSIHSHRKHCRGKLGAGCRQKSWVESCIEAATLTTDPTFSLPPLCTTEIQKRRRRDQDALDEQPLRKRRWAEAMEAAGNEHRPQSNWVEAMARTAEPILATKQNKKQEHNVHDKENCRPLHETETEPRKRKTRWDVQHVPKTSERQDSNPSPTSATIGESNAVHISETSARAPSVPSSAPERALRPTSRLPANQISNKPLPSAPIPSSSIPPLETVERLEPLYDIEMPASASLALPQLRALLLKWPTTTSLGREQGLAHPWRCLPTVLRLDSFTAFAVPQSGNQASWFSRRHFGPSVRSANRSRFALDQSPQGVRVATAFPRPPRRIWTSRPALQPNHLFQPGIAARADKARPA